MDHTSDVLKYLTINGAKYYESNSGTVSGSQGDPTRKSKTVTHTRNGKEKNKDTSNRNIDFFLSKQTLSVVVLTLKPGIEPKIVPINVAPQIVLTPETKKVIADTSCSGTWVNRTRRQINRTGVDGSTPGGVCCTP